MAYIENTLCDDVLTEIFKSFVNSDDDNTMTNVFKLSQVDSRWRQLALSDSTLWNHITIDEKVINQSIPVRQLAQDASTRANYAPSVFPRVALMLERSRTQLITVTIEIPICSLGRLPFNYFHSELLATLLSTHALRIEVFSIDTAYWKHHSLVLSIFRQKSLPNLAELNIKRQYMPMQEFEHRFDQPSLREPPCAVPYARKSTLEGDDPQNVLIYPKLRVVTLTGTNHKWNRFFGGNLTCLSIAALPFLARPTVVQLLRMLSSTRNTLECLELAGSLPFLEPDDRENFPPITLRNVTDLTLGYTMPLEVELFVDYFRVPSLLALAIHNLDGRTHDSMPFHEYTQVCQDTLSAFGSVLRHFPLEQIEDFSLSGAHFGYQPPYLPTEQNAEAGHVKLGDLPIPFQLVQRLHSVTSLALENPDRLFLTGMLYPQLDKVPKGRREYDDEEVMIPMVFSAVEDLHFDVNSDEAAHRSVVRYLNDRWQRFLKDDEDGNRVYMGESLEFLELDFSQMTPTEFRDTNWKCLSIADTYRLTVNDPDHYEPIVYENMGEE